MPSLKQLHYFLTVSDLGSFTQAAAALYVAQPALSRQMAQLEAELGFALFDRGTRGVRLAPPGAMYRERAWRCSIWCRRRKTAGNWPAGERGCCACRIRARFRHRA